MLTIKEQIIKEGKLLAELEPTNQILKNARDWWKAGACSRYPNEDTDVLQSLVSAVWFLTRHQTNEN